MYTDPTTGMEFVTVPSGRFKMGSDEFRNSKPIHWVKVSSFMIGKVPVTNGQYRAFLDYNASHRTPLYWGNCDFNHEHQPVVGVDWNDAIVFCEWLSEKSGKKYCLPSEAQWEYAARGTDGRKYPWGDEEPNENLALFNFRENAEFPAIVGSYPAGKGPFNTLDQAGNVWEWCKDVWDKEAYCSRYEKEITDPIVVAGYSDQRAIRGGCFASPIRGTLCSLRGYDNADSTDECSGFRVVLKSNINKYLCPKGCGIKGDNIVGTLKCPSCWYTW
jgi:formylglycine-generating enzyme required for sulfatase activity